MPVEQFSTLVTLLPEIEATLSKAGELLSRPDYSSVESTARAGKAADGPDESLSPKKNIEATSEEDESEE